MRLLIIVTMQFIAMSLLAQHSISNTKWMVHTELPRPGTFIWDFRKDSAYVFVDNGKQQIGSTTFLQRNDSLLIHKISGTSPCPEGSEGWYRIEWLQNGEKFKLHLLKDDCSARYLLYPQLEITRIREVRKEGN